MKKTKSIAPAELPKKPDDHTKSHLIEIIIHDLDRSFIDELLVGFFNRTRSPSNPVYVRHDVIDKRTDRNWVERRITKPQIAEVNEDPDIYYDALANIIIQPYPSQTVIFIEGIGSDLKNWDKVKTITKQIISKMQELNFEISSVKPADLLPEVQVSSQINIESEPAIAKIPNPPPKRSGLEKWFKYYDDYNKSGNTITLKELAAKSDYSYGYIRGAYPSYKREQGNMPPAKNLTKRSDKNLTKRPDKI
jgi:hypothetical protein